MKLFGRLCLLSFPSEGLVCARDMWSWFAAVREVFLSARWVRGEKSVKCSRVGSGMFGGGEDGGETGTNPGLNRV